MTTYNSISISLCEDIPYAQMYKHACTATHVYVCIHLCMYTYTSVYICICLTYTYVHTQTHTYIHVSIHTWVCIYLYMWKCGVGGILSRRLHLIIQDQQRSGITTRFVISRRPRWLRCAALSSLAALQSGNNLTRLEGTFQLDETFWMWAKRQAQERQFKSSPLPHISSTLVTNIG